MISGEIFVENGLEDALNMTRNDFNGTHPHYQKLQSVVHKFVKEEMMQDIRRRSRERRKRERAARLEQQLEEFSEKMKASWGVRVIFDTTEEPQEAPYLFNAGSKELTLFMNAKDWARAEKDRLAQMKSISALYLIKSTDSEAEEDKIISELIFRAK